MAEPANRIVHETDFRQLVRAMLEHCHGNPDLATKEVLDALKDDSRGMAVALRVTLRPYVGDLAKAPTRAHNLPDPTTKPPVPDFHVGAPAHRQPRVYVDAGGNHRTSAKQVRLRDWYTAKLDSTVNVGGAQGGYYKKLSECTAADLKLLVHMRTQKAEENAAWARKYQALAAKVAELGEDATVKDLDPETGKQILKD